MIAIISRAGDINKEFQQLANRHQLPFREFSSTLLLKAALDSGDQYKHVILEYNPKREIDLERLTKIKKEYHQCHFSLIYQNLPSRIRDGIPLYPASDISLCLSHIVQQGKT